jgi:hypothetical protein
MPFGPGGGGSSVPHPSPLPAGARAGLCFPFAPREKVAEGRMREPLPSTRVVRCCSDTTRSSDQRGRAARIISAVDLQFPYRSSIVHDPPGRPLRWGGCGAAGAGRAGVSLFLKPLGIFRKCHAQERTRPARKNELGWRARTNSAGAQERTGWRQIRANPSGRTITTESRVWAKRFWGRNPSASG